MKRQFVFAVLVGLLQLSTTACLAQGVFKWVDADGKVHYGSQPPPEQKATEPVKIRSETSFGGNNYGPSAKSEYNADGTKKIPKEVEEFRDGAIKSLKKVDSKKEGLSCATAVENVQSQFDSMIEVGQRNTKDGYISASEYEATAAKLRKAKSETTLGECESSTGNKRAFFQCMSSDRNHILGCSTQHPF